MGGGFGKVWLEVMGWMWGICCVVMVGFGWGLIWDYEWVWARIWPVVMGGFGWSG